MAVQTFTSGQILTAADTNTYLANAGLVYVTSATVGNAVSSVTVSGAFNSTYDNYKIIYSGGTMSAATNITLAIGAAATAYYAVLIYGDPAASTPVGFGDNNATKWTFAGGGSSSGTDMSVELLCPFLTQNTQMQARVRYGSLYGNNIGMLGNTTSYTSFTFAPASGTLTGGQVAVYGYRKG
jgi:hypothetical protein